MGCTLFQILVVNLLREEGGRGRGLQKREQYILSRVMVSDHFHFILNLLSLLDESIRCHLWHYYYILECLAYTVVNRHFFSMEVGVISRNVYYEKKKKKKKKETGLRGI